MHLVITTILVVLGALSQHTDAKATHHHRHRRTKVAKGARKGYVSHEHWSDDNGHDFFRDHEKPALHHPFHITQGFGPHGPFLEHHGPLHDGSPHHGGEDVHEYYHKPPFVHSFHHGGTPHDPDSNYDDEGRHMYANFHDHEPPIHVHDHEDIHDHGDMHDHEIIHHGDHEGMHHCSNCDSNADCRMGLCVCKPDYVGDGHMCQLNGAGYDGCHHNPCWNGGSCENTASGLFCDCPHGFKGTFCEQGSQNHHIEHLLHPHHMNDTEEGSDEPCDIPNPCENGGVCRRTGHGPECVCKGLYRGRYCETDNPCAPNPCRHNGACHLFGDDARCVCTNDRSGKYCEMEKEIMNDVDRHQPACHSNPCRNGGTCIDEYHGGFKCICRGGWIGALCQYRENDDPCVPDPCHHNQHCIDYGDSFRCKCVDGYEDAPCDEGHDCGCQPEPTYPPTHRPSTTHHRTSPHPPKTSPRPKTGGPPPPGNKPTKPPESPCHPNPCQNGGTCHEFDNGHNYNCICAVGYDGTHCQEDICAGCHIFAFCPNGKCKCRHGYKGDGYDCYKDPNVQCDPAVPNPGGACVPSPCAPGSPCVPPEVATSPAQDTSPPVIDAIAVCPPLGSATGLTNIPVQITQHYPHVQVSQHPAAAPQYTSPPVYPTGYPPAPTAQGPPPTASPVTIATCRSQTLI